MTTGDWIILIALLLTAGALLFFGIRSFLERGYLFNNAYIYASKEERETMNKKPYYKQTAIVFWILSSIFLVVSAALVFRNRMILLFEIPLFVGVIVFAVVSTVLIRKKEERQDEDEDRKQAEE